MPTTETDESSPSLAARAWDAVFDDPPWKAKSFLLAGAGTVGGIVSWLSELTSPAVAQMGGSYVGGFLIGWAFRRFVTAAVVTAGVVLAAIAALKATGWIELDWAALQRHVLQNASWLRGEAEGLKNLLTGYLPSAGAGGAGAFFGFRKK